MRFFKLISMILVLGTLLSGCSITERWVYRPDINQGNYYTQATLDKLQVGQTKEQVAFIMGNPMLTSVFTDNTWYYVFRTQPMYDKLSQQNVIIEFNQDGKVAQIQKTALKNSKTLEEMTRK